jgi:hypothetical protein
MEAIGSGCEEIVLDAKLFMSQHFTPYGIDSLFFFISG